MQRVIGSHPFATQSRSLLAARSLLLTRNLNFIRRAPSTRLVGALPAYVGPLSRDERWLSARPYSRPLSPRRPFPHIPLFNPRHAHAACPVRRSCSASPLSLSCAYPYLVGPRSRSNRRPATVNGPGPLCPASRTSSSLQPSARASLAPPLAPTPAAPLPHHLPPHAATAPFRCG